MFKRKLNFNFHKYIIFYCIQTNPSILKLKNKKINEIKQLNFYKLVSDD